MPIDLSLENPCEICCACCAGDSAMAGRGYLPIETEPFQFDPGAPNMAADAQRDVMRTAIVRTRMPDQGFRRARWKSR